MNDALKVLCEAKSAKAVWNDRRETWNYDIAGRAIDGEPLTVRVAISEEDNGIVLVTGF